MSRRGQPRSMMSGPLRSMQLMQETARPVKRLRAPSLRRSIEIQRFSPVDQDSLGGKQITEACPDNATTAIILELAAQIRAIWVKYWMNRGAVFESGNLHIMLDTTHANPEITVEGKHRGAGSALGAMGTEFTTALGGPGSLWVLLNVVVDNSVATDVDFRAQYTYLTN